MSPHPQPTARFLHVPLLCALVWSALAACSPQASYPARETLPPEPSPAPTSAEATPTEPAPTAPAVVQYPEYRLALVLEPQERRLVGRQQVTVPNHTGV
ncbi:MAG: hypothetical protein ACK2UY_12210, partial [Anaerolineae bacterium]